MKEKCGKTLKETHHMVYVQDGPEYHGMSDKRHRILGAGISKKTMRWHGPSTPQAIQDDYGRRFHRSPGLDPSSALPYSEESEFEYLKELALIQNNHLTIDSIRRTPRSELLDLIFPPGAAARVRDWIKLCIEKETPFIFCDVDNHCDFKASYSATELPVLLRHSTVMMITPDADDWRILTGMDHVAGLGFHTTTSTTGDYGMEPVVSILQSLKTCQVKALAGNGMHLCTQSSWMLYVLGNVSRLSSSGSSDQTFGEAASSQPNESVTFDEEF